MNIQEIIKAKMKYYKYFTQKESLEAVKQAGYALRFVNEKLFSVTKEMTVAEISKELGYEVKIIK